MYQCYINVDGFVVIVFWSHLLSLHYSTFINYFALIFPFIILVVYLPYKEEVIKNLVLVGDLVIAVWLPRLVILREQ